MPKEVKWAISIAVGLGLLALGWKMYFILVTLHVIICALLIAVIMLQSGEAADLAGAFGGAGSQTAFGQFGAATIFEDVKVGSCCSGSCGSSNNSGGSGCACSCSARTNEIS
jgi:protein translocase SecG subunit